MNAFNRLLVVIVLLAGAAASAAFFLLLFHWMELEPLHLSVPLVRFINAELYVASQQLSLFAVGAALLFLFCLFLALLEARYALPEAVLILQRDRKGSTVLIMNALNDLARWEASETPGVEGLPKVQIKRKRQGLQVRGMALLNPYVNAQEVGPVLQRRLEESIRLASGSPVDIRLKSRFQKPTARRRAR